MAEELELNLDNENFNKTEERIRNLSSKVKEAADQRDVEKTAREAAEAKAIAAEQKASFLDEFSNVSGKYTGSTDFKDKIWDKVKSGYSTEDATVSVLNAEGKLAPAAPEPVAPSGGGSAITQIPTGSLSIDTMSREDKRQALMDAEKEGELSKILRKGWNG